MGGRQTQTHTHTMIERERERKRERMGSINRLVISWMTCGDKRRSSGRWIQASIRRDARKWNNESGRNGREMAGQLLMVIEWSSRVNWTDPFALPSVKTLDGSDGCNDWKWRSMRLGPPLGFLQMISTSSSSSSFPFVCRFCCFFCCWPIYLLSFDSSASLFVSVRFITWLGFWLAADWGHCDALRISKLPASFSSFLPILDRFLEQLSDVLMAIDVLRPIPIVYRVHWELLRHLLTALAFFWSNYATPFPYH